MVNLHAQALRQTLVLALHPGRFIPIFFMSEVNLPPSAVALMYCSVPLAHSGTAYLAQALSKVLGRVPTIVLTRCLKGVG